MTEPFASDAAAAAADLGPDAFDGTQAVYDKLAAALRVSNKAALFDALAAAGITHVIVSFDGYGDSGQIEDIEAKARDEVVKLPPHEIVIAAAVWGASEPEPRSMSIADAVERLAYDLLEETHCGWENNDGAYGDFTFDVAKRSITLDYNERYTSSENYSQEF
jgi:Family of unknown function (DUF6878)